jgi:hypothetical protein
MGFLSENTAIISLSISVLLMFFGLVATWTKMRDKLDNLQARADENKDAIQRSYIELKEMFLKDLLLFRTDHDRTREIVSIHIMNSSIHQTEGEKLFRAEWRDAVMGRLDRIERGIVVLSKKSGSDSDD